MSTPMWIDQRDCLAVHDMMLARFGGSAGVRDPGLLESALARPQQLHAYGEPTRSDLAAGYAVGIIRNHPFIDGNKRTGFMMAAMFLELNGLSFTASEQEVVKFTLAMAAGELDETSYSEFLQRNSAPA